MTTRRWLFSPILRGEDERKGRGKHAAEEKRRQSAGEVGARRLCCILLVDKEFID